MKKVKIQNWRLVFDGRTIPAKVPGDITIDLYNAGIVKNPYFGDNQKGNEWIPRQDFTYISEINADETLLAQESIRLVFNGIDVYSDIYLNNQLLGSTENMFLQYRFDVKELLKLGKNELRVEMKSTLNKMDTFDTTGYYSIFNEARIFVRKAQCHFGWDWAPKICAYGIWEDVYLEYGVSCNINDAYVIADAEGNVTFLTELNYDTNPLVDANGKAIDNTYVPEDGDTLHYYLSKKPSSKDYIKKSFKVTGKKNLACFKMEDFELWWPIGYGEHPLYNYVIELERGGKVIAERSGKLGFRSVRLLEKPKSDNSLGYELEINGKVIFVRGANWIPIECFTGVVEDEKYDRLTDLAAQGNFNMLRVWGGGIYEKDIFYNLCDEKGIMVWQDIMLACADIPEDKPEWVDNMLREVDYQVRRLRNHTSLVYWCGGNEKTGAYGRCITKGDFFVNVLLRGAIMNLDRTRPYATQSPCSWTDVGQDSTSGESHHNSFERSLLEKPEVYRSLVAEKVVPFVSEAALMGPNTVETNKKIYPEDKLWPMNELWDDRLMENPYGSVPMTFAKRQMKYAEDHYGKVKSLEDFTAKAMQVHAECMRAEAEFTRSNEGRTGGFMNWMYSDIWPSGSWSAIDYWCEPKQVYYQMMRSYAPRLVTFVENNKGETELVVINDTLQPYSTPIRYGIKTFDGKILSESETQVTNLTGVYKERIDCDKERKDVYLFAEYVENGEGRSIVYSSKFWSGVRFTSDYDVETEKLDACSVKVTIKANAFAKSVFISLKDNYKYLYSDNYIDVEAGKEKSVIITAEEPIDESQIIVTDFAKVTA
ncbi:MAG: hypothetical protein IKA20_01635 [Clostridia bacterium]|nr:hypothetical protein [Clostridia bacterium]